MVPGPSGHGASGSTINRAVDIRATSATPWPQVTQPCAPSTSTQRANERDASTDGNLSSRVSLHFDYRPQPLHVSTPVRRNALNPETRTVQAAAAETSRSGVSVLAPVPDGDVVVLPGALEDVTNVYPTPSTTRPRRAADRSIQLTEGGATDSSSGSRDLLAPVLLQALAIDNAFPLARRSTRDHLLGQASNGTSGSRASSMQVERGTVLQDTLAAPSQPSPASSWGTVNSRVSGSTSRSSLALGLTGLPTELELPPAAAEEEQTAYVPLPNPSRHTSTLLEPNMTPRGRRVSFRGDFFDAVPQSSGQRSEPPALGLNLGSDNSGQVIHGDRDLAHLDQSLMQLAVGHRENERSRTASPLRYSAGTEPSAPSRASGQQVWVGPRTGLPIYMTPTPGIVEDASGSSVAPGTSRAVFSSWHNNNSADVFSGPASGSTRHTGMTYPYSDSSTRLARQRSSVSRSSIASSRESSVSAYSFHGASGPRSSGSSHSHTHNSANSSTRHQTGTREVYGVPVSDDDRLPALSQGSLLLSFGTPSTSSAVIGTEEASEIRAPRPISSRSSSLFGSLASL
ncbi:hypothetical protein CERSUDRAFT_115471 [Gelatoporia subvermispora B]|uniref:Uncharacterized protein n=1 Tax=Ceriporiopsis subvermispora (strain B) TaxID=914234 RepID=M2RDF3_CERS8|nr:hypothetical protein CERSUDRAFT_115471 [Gelatoporia subvermispora B]